MSESNESDERGALVLVPDAGHVLARIKALFRIERSIKTAPRKKRDR